MKTNLKIAKIIDEFLPACPQISDREDVRQNLNNAFNLLINEHNFHCIHCEKKSLTVGFCKDCQSKISDLEITVDKNEPLKKGLKIQISL